MFSNLEFASPSLSEKEHYSGAQSQSSSIPIHPHQEDAEALAHDLLSKGGGERQQRRSWWTSGSIWPLVIVALVTAIVVGAAVGGGLASQLTSGQDKTVQCAPGQDASQLASPTTVTITRTTAAYSTTSTAAGGLLMDYIPERPGNNPGDVSTLALDCPGRDGEVYSTSYTSGAQSSQFAIDCQGDIGGGILVAITAYTFNDCIEACASMNFNANDDACTQIVFHGYMYYHDAPTWQKCWLMNSSAVPPDEPTSEAVYRRHMATAKLLQTS